MKSKVLLTCIAITFAFSSIAHCNVIVVSDGDTRLFNSNTTANGGNTATGRLIGINTGGVDNVLLQEFGNSAGLAGLAGSTVSGATITAGIAVGFTNANHGTTADIINLNEIAIGNLGYDRGSSVITNGSVTDGSASWDFRSTIGDGTDVQWVDASGASVANILGALTVVDTTAGYDQGTGGAPPLNGELTFNVSAAVAQGWIDNGLAGLALSTTDDGDSRSRFNFLSSDNFQIDFKVVNIPEPSAGLIGALAGLFAVSRRRR